MVTCPICSPVVARWLAGTSESLPPSLLPVLASYIAELKPTSTGAPVALYKPEAYALKLAILCVYITIQFLEGCVQLCWLGLHNNYYITVIHSHCNSLILN